jgi:hypothetical protein
MACKMMVRWLVCAVICLLPVSAAAGSAPPDAVMGEPVHTVLAAEDDHTVLQITFPLLTAPGDWATAGKIAWNGIITEWHCPETGIAEPVAPVHGLHAAVGGHAVPTWRIAAVRWYRQPQDPASALAEVGLPIVFRGVPIAPIEIFPESGQGVMAGLILEIQHPPPAGFQKSLADPAAVKRASAERAPVSLANPDHFRDLRAWSMTRSPAAKSDRSVSPFTLTDNWVRLEVRQPGVYALSGQQLELLGVDLADLDPASLRVFKGGGLALDPDPSLDDTEQAQSVGLTEIPIDLWAGEQEFSADDRLLFYGFGTDIWLDRLVPDAEPLAHYTHPFQDTGIYWLTWDSHDESSDFPYSPKRVGPPQASAPDGSPTITTHRARYHGEQNNEYAAGLVEDNWVWVSGIRTSNTQTMALNAVVPETEAYWQVDICGTRTDSLSAQSRQMQTIVRINNDVDGQVTRNWSMTNDQSGQPQVRISGTTAALRAGSNSIRIENGNHGQSRNPFALDSYDVLYTATLDKNAYAGALTSVFWGDQVSEPDTRHDVRYTLPAAGQMHLWDVTEPQSVFALAGTETSGPPRTLTVSLRQDPGQTRHLVLFSREDPLSVTAADRPQVRDLRGELDPADYIVIHPAAFSVAAQRLADLRSRALPGVESPEAVTVALEDIYANFSGGQKDWRAIRQFLRWHFYDLPGGQRLQWVCLLGNASRDYRNYRQVNPATRLFDWVPTDITTNFPSLFLYTYLSHPYAADGSLAALDPPASPHISIDMPDLAVGRLPANSAAEAIAMVERTKAHIDQLPAGVWRNRLTLCADDLIGSYPATTERRHMDQAERLATQFIPSSLELDKIYLDAYPFEGLYKPAGQRALLASLDAGTTMFYYVGHGGSHQLADEQVFLSDFIPSLANGGRRFLFAAFSCDVGVFDDPGGRSMAELFLMSNQGGAIASIAASWVSHITPNDLLSNRFFESLYPRQPQPGVDPTITIGAALLSGKIGVWISNDRARNAMRYNLFGDPALRLENPAADLAFATGSADSLLTGRIHNLQIELPGSAGRGYSGAQYQLLVQDSSYDVPYSAPLQSSTWSRSGNIIFRGTGTLTQDDAVIPFLTPLAMRTGEEGRIRLLIDTGDMHRAAFLQAPVVQTSSDASHDVQGPDIRISFAGGRLRVQPGAELTAALFDTSGISILATNPANSVQMEFDDSGVYNNVSDAVVFEPGSYTRARLHTALPSDLELGSHQVVMTASDMFGNVGSDTLRFTLEAAGVAALRDAAVFPNPTSGPCRLVCDLTAAMDLRWDVYTVSGRRVRSISPGRTSAVGPVILEWDGRDAEGDAIANGVYLYVLRGTIPGSDHEIRETGQIVIMR